MVVMGVVMVAMGVAVGMTVYLLHRLMRVAYVILIFLNLHFVIFFYRVIF